MDRCAVCGKELDLPYRCNYCDEVFCIDHHVPENHHCPGVPQARAKPTGLQEIDKAEKSNIPRKTSKTIVALCLLLALLPLIVGYGAYNLSYGNGYQDGLSSGSQSGYNEEFSSGSASGYQTGYLQGVEDGAGRGYNIRDPTYQEMLNFIAADQTDKNTYSATYNCENFAADVINNAFKNGIRCGYVVIDYSSTWGHSIVSFNTTDHGLVFIEPQFDKIVTLVIGQSYAGTNGFELPTTYSDTIVRYINVW